MAKYVLYARHNGMYIPVPEVEWDEDIHSAKTKEEMIDYLIHDMDIWADDEAQDLLEEFKEITGLDAVDVATDDEFDQYDGEFWAMGE